MLDPQKLSAALDKVLPFARAAEAIAKRIAGKTQALALLGVAGAAWLSYACYSHFDLSWPALLPIAAVFFIAPLLLLKAAFTLRGIIGLPERITATVTGLAGKAGEYRALYDNRAQTLQASPRPTLKHLWAVAKSLLEVKGLGDEAKSVVALAGDAFAIANPIFTVLLAVAAFVNVAIVIVAAIVGLVFVF